MKERNGRWGRWLPGTHLSVLLAAAASGNTVLAVAPRQGSLTDGLCFLSQASSCTTVNSARHARPATAGLGSIAGRPPSSAGSRRPALTGPGVTGVSGWGFKRRGQGEARAEGAASAGAGAGSEEIDDVEEQEKKKALGELDRR